MVSRQNADIADTLHIRDVTMVITFCLLMGYNFGCMIASDTLFDSRGGFFQVLRDVGMLPWQPFLYFCIWGTHWRHRANTTDPSMCGGDAALCQITLTTCFSLAAVRRHRRSVLGCRTFSLASLTVWNSLSDSLRVPTLQVPLTVFNVI